MAKNQTLKIDRLPVHIAIVPDGNGRWAQSRGLPRLAGHQAGAETMLRMVDLLTDYPIPYVTLYGFSTENWGRPAEEVSGLFEMLSRFIDSHLEFIRSKGIKLRRIGRLDRLPSEFTASIERAVEATKDNTHTSLSIAFNYGGRAEIIDAAKGIVRDGIPEAEITEATFEKFLYTAGMPPVDLLVRTGKEERFSNFLIWQTAYSEYYLSDVLWPDFGKKDMDKALLSFSQRRRRFGGL